MAEMGCPSIGKLDSSAARKTIVISWTINTVPLKALIASVRVARVALGSGSLPATPAQKADELVFLTC